MTAVEIPVEKWPGAVREVTLGSSYGGGTRTSTVTVGGETTLPFLGFEGALPHRPALAVEVVDMEPGDWSSELVAAWGDDLRDPARWAARAVAEGAELIALKLRSCHPDYGDRSATDARATVGRVLAAVGVPLIVYGPGTAGKDN
jgi:acetyl-CoA decarbonylase/synthase, CODH/ACS complex subunit delta